MPNSLTAAGLQTATQAELLAQLTAAYQAIYGSDINLGSDTPDGQMMNIYIQGNLDILDLIAQVYNSFDPDNAIGVVLDQRVAINGIQRQGGTFSQTNINIVISGSVNLYGIDQSIQPVYTVSDNQGNQWQLITTVTGATTGNYLFQAAIPGAVLTTPNTINIPVSVVIGVLSVNNPSVAVNTGINSETDAVLKVRRQKSTSLQSQGYFQALTAALENINGITGAIVHENDSGSTDINGIPGHSIWVIVSGTPSVSLALAYNSLTTYSYGSIASSGGVNYISVANNNTGNLISNPAFWNVYNPIAQAIYNYRNAGCGMKGSTVNNVIQVDGTSFPVYWDVVTNINPFIKISVGSLNLSNPPNIASIISYIVSNFIPGVDAEVNINQLSTLVQAADPNTLAIFPAGYGFSLASGGAYTYTLSPAALNNQFQISAANIIVLPIGLSCPNAVLSFGTNGILTGISTTVVHGGTIVFSAVGGYSTLTWSKTGAGSVSPSTGASTTYTSVSVGTDTVIVTDALGNTMTATIVVT